jgi:hypothetical protein
MIELAVATTRCVARATFAVATRARDYARSALTVSHGAQIELTLEQLSNPRLYLCFCVNTALLPQYVPRGAYCGKSAVFTQLMCLWLQ